MNLKTLLILLVICHSITSMRICSPNIADRKCIPGPFGSGLGGTGQNCGGAENPEIRWTNEGAEWAQSYVMMMDDITNNDDFIHWLVKDIPPGVFVIPRGASGTNKVPGVDVGNSFGPQGYGAPCGAAANTYRFTIYGMTGATTEISAQGKKSNDVFNYLFANGAITMAGFQAIYFRNGTACPDVPVPCDLGNNNQPDPDPETTEASSTSEEEESKEASSTKLEESASSSPPEESSVPSSSNNAASSTFVENTLNTQPSSSWETGEDSTTQQPPRDTTPDIAQSSAEQNVKFFTMLLLGMFCILLI